MNCSLDVIPTTANWIKSILKIMPKLVLTKVTKAQPYFLYSHLLWIDSKHSSRCTSCSTCYSYCSAIFYLLHFLMKEFVISLVVINIPVVEMRSYVLYTVTKDWCGKKAWSFRDNPIVLFTLLSMLFRCS